MLVQYNWSIKTTYLMCESYSRLMIFWTQPRQKWLLETVSYIQINKTSHISTLILFLIDCSKPTSCWLQQQLSSREKMSIFLKPADCCSQRVYWGKHVYCFTGPEQIAHCVCSGSCMQSQAHGQCDPWTDIESICIRRRKNHHYIHYSLSEST